MKESSGFDKGLFLSAAIWNIVTGQLSLVEFKSHLELFFHYSPETPDFIFMLYHVNLWGFVTIMGIGYYLVSTDTTKNHGLVTVGYLLKIFICLTWAYAYYLGRASNFLLFSGIVDLIFALLFIHFLYRAKKSESA